MTAVQEAAATTIQLKIRSIAAKKEVQARWKQSQIEKLNILAVFTNTKDRPTPKHLETTSTPTNTSRVSIAATCTLQEWFRCVLEEMHYERVQTAKQEDINNDTVLLSSGPANHNASRQVWKQLFLLLVACFCMLFGAHIQHMDDPTGTSSAVKHLERETTNETLTNTNSTFHVDPEAIFEYPFIPSSVTGENTNERNGSTLHVTATRIRQSVLDFIPPHVTMNVTRLNNSPSKRDAWLVSHSINNTNTLPIDIDVSAEDSNTATLAVPQQRGDRHFSKTLDDEATTKTNSANAINDSLEPNCEVVKPILSPELLTRVQQLLEKSREGGNTLRLFGGFVECALALNGDYSGLLNCTKQE